MESLKQMMSAYAKQATEHTGLHYIPSFNDMCSNSADDADDRLVKETKERKLLAVGAQHPITPPTLPTHNKEDSWPTFETADIHKVNRHDPKTGRKQLYDTVKPNSPSVWEMILQSEKVKHESSSGQSRVDKGINMPSSSSSRGGNATGSFSPLVEEPSSGLHSEPHHAVPHPGTGEGPTFRGEYQGPSRSEEEVHGLEREIEFYGGNA